MRNNSLLKSSYYNFMIAQMDGSYIIYNSLTGVIISVHDKEEAAKIKELLEKSEILYNEEDSIIKLLFDKGILVERDKDEYEYLRYLYEKEMIKSNELSLTLITTRQCNLRCVYCYEKHENLVMGEDVYRNLELYIQNSVEDKEFSAVNITLFGGEPFLEYDRIIKFLKNVRNICEKNHIAFGAGATTNGVLIYPERFEELYKLGVNYYQITVDGFAETHDKYRASADSKGSFERIIKNLKYMKHTNYDFVVTIRTNFNEEVWKRAKEFYQFIKENFDDRFHVYYEGIKKLGGQNDDNLNVLGIKEVSESSVDMAEYVRDLGLKNDVVDTMTMPFSRVCYATKHNDYIIDYDGSILKCTLSLDDDLNKIGYLEEDGVMNIDEVKHSRWVGKKAEIKGECKECRVLPLCYGGRCVNGLVHGEKFSCDCKEQEKELEELIVYNL